MMIFAWTRFRCHDLIPRYHLGSVKDTKETERIANSTSEIPEHRQRYTKAHALEQDADASYANTLIEYVVCTLYLTQRGIPCSPTAPSSGSL
jgi:hypothetical protein